MKNTRCDACQKETPGIEGQAAGYWYAQLRVFKNTPGGTSLATPQQNAEIEACSPECLRVALEEAVKKRILLTVESEQRPKQS